MNFESVLGVVSGFLEEKGVHFAVIGVAIAAYGLPRTTLDLDFTVMADVRFLLTLPGVDRSQIRNYFDLKA